ncbi:unnamed protein product [Nezara viridula]|uniref:Uncharacterized protein n=1 Tax=Nezara viridula TaxID=85310 RepID=A0A9P0MSV0_NEZVI|nr:unnamed protein product [Nezara viridula]
MKGHERSPWYAANSKAGHYNGSSNDSFQIDFLLEEVEAGFSRRTLGNWFWAFLQIPIAPSSSAFVDPAPRMKRESGSQVSTSGFVNIRRRSTVSLIGQSLFPLATINRAFVRAFAQFLSHLIALDRLRHVPKCSVIYRVRD